MSGQAQKLFRPSIVSKAIAPKWENLHDLVAKGYLAHIDLALTNELLRHIPQSDESVAAVICHLSASTRQGHLCIDVKEGVVNPAVVDIWKQSDTANAAVNPIPEQLVQKLEALICKGMQLLPESIVKDLSILATDLQTLRLPLGKADQRLYFQRQWAFETLFIKELTRISTSVPEMSIDSLQVDHSVQRLLDANKLLPEQAEAIKNSCHHSLSVICGGPGTGKTYTAAQLVNLICTVLGEEKGFQIALAAPTGKAAANLQKSLASGCDAYVAAKIPTAKTLHNLLGIRGGEAPKALRLPLQADLIIVDESSMIDVRMMAYLFAAVKPGARLILLGDPDQLPAVEAGSLFSDLIAVIKKNPSKEHGGCVNFLTKCLRAELQGLINFASAVNAQDVVQCQAILAGSGDGSVCRLSFDENVCERLLEQARLFYRCSNETTMPPQLLKHFERFRILSPFRQGPYGVEAINQLLAKELHRHRKEGAPFIAPIMLLKNDARQNLFNGEVGILVSHQFSAGTDISISRGDYACFPDPHDPEAVRTIPALLLPAFEYAYCLSVHKSQGSEFEQVLLVLPEGSEVFGREVLYTAITRAKKKLILMDFPGTLEKTLARVNHRLSGIADRFVFNK